MELIEALGISNPWVLLAQFVNFAILLFILYKLAYGPILKALDERRDKIKKGLDDAKEAQDQLARSQQQQEEIIKNAKKEAQQIITKAEEVGKNNRDEIIAIAKEESQKMIEKTRKAMEEEKRKMSEEIKKETVELVVLTTEKVLAQKIDEQKDMQIIKESIQ
jgi:F-type H+-transporting ATPase subunit b